MEGGQEEGGLALWDLNSESADSDDDMSDSMPEVCAAGGVEGNVQSRDAEAKDDAEVEREAEQCKPAGAPSRQRKQRECRVLALPVGTPVHALWTTDWQRPNQRVRGMVVQVAIELDESSRHAPRKVRHQILHHDDGSTAWYTDLEGVEYDRRALVPYRELESCGLLGAGRPHRAQRRTLAPQQRCASHVATAPSAIQPPTHPAAPLARAKRSRASMLRCSERLHEDEDNEEGNPEPDGGSIVTTHQVGEGRLVERPETPYYATGAAQDDDQGGTQGETAEGGGATGGTTPVTHHGGRKLLLSHGSSTGYLNVIDRRASSALPHARVSASRPYEARGPKPRRRSLGFYATAVDAAVAVAAHYESLGRAGPTSHVELETDPRPTLTTHAQGLALHLMPASTSGYKCVQWHAKSGKWRVEVERRGRKRKLGNFTTKVEAAVRYAQFVAT